MNARHRLIVTAMVAAAFFLFWAPGQVSADVLHVPSEYASIQDAIDLAVDGDTVLVEAGTYSERLVFNGAAITVESTAGPSETVIDAGQQGPVVVFDYDNRSTLRGFTLKNGFGDGSPYIRGGGVVIYWANPVIEHCVITENEGAQGGGVAAIGGGILRRCKIFRNRASVQGGGAFSLPFGDPLVLVSTLVAENESNGPGDDEGAGIDGTVTMTNCSVFNNVGGYGISNADGSTITNTIVYGNEGGQIGSTSIDVAFSNIENGFDGEGNIDQNPLVDNDGDYRLTAGSPCIDSGTLVEDVTDDIDGEPRPFGLGFDMGSDEYTISADTVPNEPPVADGSGPYAGKAGEVIEFDGSASYDPDGEIVLYEWDWESDGTYDDSSPASTMTHTWDTPFSGSVTLQVEDSNGVKAQGTVQVEVAPAGGKRRIYSKLGDQRHRWGSDIDIFEFKGIKGEKVKIRLKKDRSQKGRGQQAILVLQDRIRRVWFCRVDYGNLPGKICAVLPKTGKYRISVIQSPKWRRWGRGKGFAGAYCLSVKSSKDAWKTLKPTWRVEGAVVK